MNAQTKDELILELIGDLEAEQGFALSPEKRRQIDEALRDYLEKMEEYKSKQERNQK